jgi:hypothetical protein
MATITGKSSVPEEVRRVFPLFGFLTLAALAYFILRVPETKGRSLQSIERDLRGLPAPTAAGVAPGRAGGPPPVPGA